MNRSRTTLGFSLLLCLLAGVLTCPQPQARADSKMIQISTSLPRISPIHLDSHDLTDAQAQIARWVESSGNQIAWLRDEKAPKASASDDVQLGRLILQIVRFAEVIPPRNGSEQRKVLTQMGALIEAGAQFLAVTKGAGGSLRGGSLPIAQTIKEQFGRPAIAHFTCRDLTPADVENQLMDHHYFGIRNILALRGDPPRGTQEWKPREGGYNYAYQLIEQIRALNEGRYIQRTDGPAADGSEKTDFCIGAAVYPEHENAQERIDFFKIKAKAGAEYGITQMIFDADCYARFVDLCAKNGVSLPILPGTRVLKSRKQAERLAKLFQVSVPAELLNALPEDDSPDSARIGVEIFLKYAERLRALGAPGIHVYVIGDTEVASTALRELAVVTARPRPELLI